MTFVVDDRTIGTWFMQLDQHTDVMAGLGADVDGNRFLDWRFRYFAGTIAQHSNWHRHVVPADKTTASAIAKVHDSLDILRESYTEAGPLIEILMDHTGIDGFMARLREHLDFKAMIPKGENGSPEEALETYRNLMTATPAGRA